MLQVHTYKKIGVDIGNQVWPLEGQMSLSQEINDYIAIYKRWRNGINWINAQESPRPKDQQDLLKLEARVDYLWDNLNDEERAIVFDELCKVELFPGFFKEIFDSSKGKLTGIKKEKF